MTTEYEKLELEDLPKAAVVNSTVHAQNQEVEELIHEVVSDHISKIVDEDVNSDIESSQEVAKDIDESSEVPQESEVKIDVDAVKEEYYQKGLEEAKVKYEAMLAESGSEGDLSEKLAQKLAMISPELDIDSQVTKVSAESISGIAKKLHLILPANFEEIISNGLIEKLKSFYKEGSIALTIHPDRYDFCTELLQLDSVPSKFKDNFQIIKDEKLGMDDCVLDWNENRLEYNQEQLAAEIDKIIEQLKSATTA